MEVKDCDSGGFKKLISLTLLPETSEEFFVEREINFNKSFKYCFKSLNCLFCVLVCAQA